MKKIKEFWASLDDVATVSKREFFLGLTCCALAGVVLGIFFSPNKTVTIGSNNGNKGDCFYNGKDSTDEEDLEGCE